MVHMRPNSRRAVIGLVALGVLALPAAAIAAEIELGSTKTALVAPACPSGVSTSQCTIILTKVTAIETLRDGVAYPSTVKQAGRIVAFTVGLSQLSTSKATRKSVIHYLDSTYGGTTRVALTVLRAVGKNGQWRWQVVAQSPVFHVEPYLGTVVQLPLEQSIEVKPGEVIGLTTPTWAPVLTIDLASKQFAYRQSRNTGCGSPPGANDAQMTTNETTSYGCNYAGTRVEYSATEVTYPLGTNPVQ